MISLPVVFTFLLTISKILAHDEEEKLERRFVYNVFRHGARATEKGLDAQGNDMFGANWAAPAELTVVGQRMHYLLGRRNRIKYSDFLNKEYSPAEIFVRSSDYNRTNMSGQAHLQGLYPVGSGPVLNEWQKSIAFPQVGHNFGSANIDSDGAIPGKINVLPIHIFPRDEFKYFFFYTFHGCLPLVDIFTANKQSPSIVAFMDKFRVEFGEKISTAMNLPADFWNDMTNFHHFFDGFISGYYEGKEFKSLEEAGIDLKAMNTTAFEFEKEFLYEYYNGGEDYMLPKVTFSGMFDELLQWLETRINLDISGNLEYTTYHAPKTVFFFLHDVTLTSLMKYLHKVIPEFNELYYTPFASHLAIELLKPEGKDATSADEYSIKFDFNDNVFGPIKYKYFVEKAKSQYMSSEDILNFCQPKKDKDQDENQQQDDIDSQESELDSESSKEKNENHKKGHKHGLKKGHKSDFLQA